jgi:hypothetical protein
MDLGVVMWGGVGKPINVGEPVIYIYDIAISIDFFPRVLCLGWGGVY